MSIISSNIPPRFLSEDPPNIPLMISSRIPFYFFFIEKNLKFSLQRFSKDFLVISSRYSCSGFSKASSGHFHKHSSLILAYFLDLLRMFVKNFFRNSEISPKAVSGFCPKLPLEILPLNPFAMFSNIFSEFLQILSESFLN